MGQTGDQKDPGSTRAGTLPGNERPWASCLHTCLKLFTKQYNLVPVTAVMPCGWEGNRRSGVALAMHHGLSGLYTYRLNGYRKGDKQPAYASEGHGMLYLFLKFYRLIQTIKVAHAF